MAEENKTENTQGNGDLGVVGSSHVYVVERKHPIKNHWFAWEYFSSYKKAEQHIKEIGGSKKNHRIAEHRIW